MEEYEKSLKHYFDKEVAGKRIPPMIIPEKKRAFRWDFLFLAACTLGCLTLLVQPAIYDNRIRRSYIPISRYEAFKENVPRVIFEGFKYYKESKGAGNEKNISGLERYYIACGFSNADQKNNRS